MSTAGAARTGGIVVRVGELRISPGEDVLFAIGLGSCVAVALYDSEQRIGGLAHIMLPSPADARAGAPPGRFASSGIALLLDMMQASGAARQLVSARIAGGASMFAGVLPESGRNLGERNIEAVRAALLHASVPIIGEDVGGMHGRSVYLDTRAGSVVVSSVGFGDVVL
jgi:chemotaxis protein CheD